MKKLYIAKYNKALIAALQEEGQIVELSFLPDPSELKTGDICVGRVEKVKSELSAAFLSLAYGKTAYLQSDKAANYRQGDLVAVRVEREASKNKHIQVSDRLSLYGDTVAVTEGKKPAGISARISEESERDRLKKLLTDFAASHADQDYSYIARTNACFADSQRIWAEAEQLIKQLSNIRERSKYAVKYSMLFCAKSGIERLVDINGTSGDLCIATDDSSIYEQLKNKYKSEPYRLVLHDDKMPLYLACGIDRALDAALKKKVWLRSGGYIVIESTEALTVIDVNSGKSGKRNSEDYFLQLNAEAAKAIAFELRLRNISGIIIVDFIDMKNAADRDRLTEKLRSEIAADPIRTTFHGLTNLGLAELTRKKVSAPLYEQAEKWIKGRKTIENSCI